jgi:hypothetical protein
MGRAWYPTSALLPDGRVLVTGGFTDYGTDTCVGAVCLNSQINVFDPANNTWSVLIDGSASDDVIGPGVREYTRMVVLPQPVTAGGLLRHVLLMGKAGVVVLLNIDPDTPMQARLFRPLGGVRPLPKSITYQVLTPTIFDYSVSFLLFSTQMIHLLHLSQQCDDRSDQSTFVPLVHTRGGSGEVAVIGGGCGESQQRVDLYSVRTDSWQSIDLGVRRMVPSAALLPDGRVLIAHGENPELDQAACHDRP